ncbi:MAG: CRTAC1 family protein [Planctomycetota bacterium]|jgi:hypothetical protein
MLRTLSTGLALSFALLAGSLPAQQLPGTFVDVSDDPLAPDDAGIDFLYTLISSSYTQMGGASCADFDNDGWTDIFLPANKDERNHLYRNLGDGTFEEVGFAYGVGDGPTASATGIFFDYDNDGDLDIVVAAHAGNTGAPTWPLMRLFRNEGAAGAYHFENVSLDAGFALAPTVWGTDFGWQGGIAVGDYDQDGYLDVFATWWWNDSDPNMWRLFKSVENPMRGDPSDPTYTPRVFVDATIEAGLDFPFVGEPWQPQFMDVNRDGWPDLHVNDDFDLDYMFLNNTNGTFTDVAAALNLNGVPPEGRNEMGSAMGDIDLDGDFDLHLTNLFEADRFYRADSAPGTVTYVDMALATGTHNSPWGWGNILFDFDLDGDLDHATVSGFKLPTVVAYHNMFHINLYPETLPDGVTVKWQNAALQVPEFSKIFEQMGDAARGLTWLDYDNDGDVDLVVTRHQDTTALYKNTLSTPNRWLQVDLTEAGGSLNTVGATVWVKTDDRLQMREVVAGSSFMCQEPPRLHFGLGLAGTDTPQPGQRGTPGAPGGPGIAAGARSAGVGGGMTSGGGGTSAPIGEGPKWLVVRWLDGAYQIVKKPGVNAIVDVARSAVDDAGDMDADGHLTPTDEAMLFEAVIHPNGFDVLYPDSPGKVVGDLDRNGFIEMADYDLWASLPPH